MSTSVDSILALCVVIEHLRDFRTELFAAFVKLRKAFESVNRVALRILALCGIPSKGVNIRAVF